MTLEEAIKALRLERGIEINGNAVRVAEFLQGLDVALSALRPVSREKVEKVFHGCPECKPRCGLCIHMGAWDKYGKPYVCEQCVDCSNFKSDQRFCEVCGAPMTDEAVEMVMERMEALYERNDD